MGHQVGDRVGAIYSTRFKTIYFYGFGTYAGHEVPPNDLAGMGRMYHELGIENSKILLDSGKTVWGFECWWDSEDRIKTILSTGQVVNVDIDNARGKTTKEVEDG